MQGKDLVIWRQGIKKGCYFGLKTIKLCLTHTVEKRTIKLASKKAE